MHEKNGHNQYIKDFIETQNKQYLPGEYLGGKLPFGLIYPNRSIGYLLLINGLVVIIVFLATSGLFNKDTFDTVNLVGVSMPVIYGLASTVAGFNIIRRFKN